MRLNIIILTITILAGATLTWWLDHKMSAPLVVPLSEVVDIPVAAQDSIVPDFQFTDIKGHTHNITSFRGKVVILNFWATWCAPCVVEFPKLITLAAQNPDMVVIALSGDTGISAIEKFLEKYPPKSKNFYVAHDVRRKIATDLFQTFKLPESIILDLQGNMVRKILGDTDWLGAEMVSYLQGLQGKTEDSPLGSPSLKD